MPAALVALTGVASFAPQTLLLLVAAALMSSSALLVAGWWFVGSPAAYGLLETNDRLPIVLRTIMSVIAIAAGLAVILPAIQQAPTVSIFLFAMVSYFAIQLVHVMCLFRLSSLLGRHTSRRLRRMAPVFTWVAIGGLILPCVSGGFWESLVRMIDDQQSVMLSRVLLIVVLLAFCGWWAVLARTFRRLASDAREAWVSD